MREDYQEKTEPPTKKRIKEAREKGHVYKSHDTTVSGMLLFNMILLLFFSGYMYEKLYILCKAIFTHLNYSFDSPDLVIFWMNEGSWYLALLLAPLLLGTLAGAFIINLCQVGFVFSFTPLKPKWSHLNFFDGENYKKFFDLRVLLKIFLGQLRIIAVTISSVWLIGGDIFSIYNLTTAPAYKVLRYTFVKAMQVGFFLAISYLLIGLIEFAYHRYRYYKELMMTPREVREEIRRSEGNLEVKGHIYSFMKKFINAPIKANISQATVIVTSTTHGLSVALFFHQNTMAAPLCIAKGIMGRSKELIDKGERYSVPIIENALVAKRLYGFIKVGQYVPKQMFYEVAKILALAEKKKKMLESHERSRNSEELMHHD